MTSESPKRRPDAAHGSPLEKAAALAALALASPAPVGSCPTPEHIQAWHEGRLSGGEADSVRSHVAHCDTCFALWTGLADLSEAPPPAGAPDSVPRRWYARPFTALAGMAAIALLALVVLPRLTTAPGGDLPVYDLRFAGSATLRGDKPTDSLDPVRLAGGDRFELTLVPHTTVEGVVEARAYVLKPDGSVTTLSAPPAEQLGKGVIRIRGTVGSDVGLPAGRSMLLIAVGRAGALPDSQTLRRTLTQNSPAGEAGWTGWRVSLEVRTGL